MNAINVITDMLTGHV